MKRVGLNMRVSSYAKDLLKELCEETGKSQSEMVEAMITAIYDLEKRRLRELETMLNMAESESLETFYRAQKALAEELLAKVGIVKR